MIDYTNSTAFIWHLLSVVLVGVTLHLKYIKKTNLIRVNYCCISHYFYFKSCLYMCQWQDRVLTYKGGCGIQVLRHLKEELA